MSEEGSIPVKEVLLSKRFNIGEDIFAFANVGDATEAIKEGFVPSPSEYDILGLFAVVPERPFGDTRGQPTANMERRLEYEEPRVAKKLNEKYGQGNWRLVELKRANDPKSEPVLLKLMLKEEVAREKFGRSAQF